jgi:hypothetical protein
VRSPDDVRLAKISELNDCVYELVDLNPISTPPRPTAGESIEPLATEVAPPSTETPPRRPK